MFWEVVEQKPGPIVAAIVMLGIVELISGFAITQAKVNHDSLLLSITVETGLFPSLSFH